MARRHFLLAIVALAISGVGLWYGTQRTKIAQAASLAPPGNEARPPLSEAPPSAQQQRATPPVGVGKGETQKVAGDQKRSEASLVTSAVPSPLADVGRSRADASVVPNPPPESPKGANVAALTAADVLSQKLDLSDPVKRAEVVRQLRQIEDAERKEAWERAAKLGIPTEGDTQNGGRFVLVSFDGNRPVYRTTKNFYAAISTAAHQVRAPVPFNIAAPFNVTGASVTVGIWDGGSPLLTHEEFGGRVRFLDDPTKPVNSHANHVAGTIGAAGINPLVKGMAPGSSIDAHYFLNELPEMTDAAATAPGQVGKLYISNHSYGDNLGWEADLNAARDGYENWRWYGEFTAMANSAVKFEYIFGEYSKKMAAYDGLCYHLPYYLPVFVAGNDRDDGPPPDQALWKGVKYLPDGTENVVSAQNYDPTQHPVRDGAYKNGYDTLNSVAKNVLVIGAIQGAAVGGSRSVASARLTDFSSTGPTDDGRIKPDIVAHGLDVRSTGTASNTDTISDSSLKSGTSMAAPNVTGSAALLIDYYGTRFPGQSMRASTLKGLIIHTADDLGNPGPDYQYGWGLMNTKAAADLIKRHADKIGDESDKRLIEGTLAVEKIEKTYSMEWNGTDPIRVTLCWTDPPGAASLTHDDRTRKLVNDLDLKITGPTTVTDTGPTETTYLPSLLSGH